MMKRASVTVCFLLFCGLFPRPSAAQLNGAENGHTPVTARNITTIPFLSGTIELDGVIERSEWEMMLPLDVTMYGPVFEGEMSERTEIRVAHDGRYLYVSGRLFDSDPSGIRANTLCRDRYSGDDLLAVVLDSWNDNENGLWFVTTPTGVRLDMTIANDAEFAGNGPPVNDSWNTYWDSATSRDEEGWYAEMRIPFSSLGFRDDDGAVTMGLIVNRLVARKNERYTWPAIPPNWDMGHIKPSQGQRVRFEGVRSRNPVYISPYFLGGLSYNSAIAGAPIPAGAQTGRQGEMGLDIRSNLTSNLTLNLTFNTDFAQVEADDQMVNLSRFSLFFPEKRQFFQERSSLFDFPMVDGGQLFYSRRIGLSDDGEPVRIVGGGRLVGRVGNWDVGVLDMQTDQAGSLPSENLGVVRIRRQVLNPFSYAGGMLTSRIGDDGRENLAWGLDSQIRLFGDEYLSTRWAQTFDREVMDRAGYRPLDSGFFQTQWQRRRALGLNYFVTWAWSGADFDPGLGFRRRNDFQFANTLIRYNRLAGDSSLLRSWGPQIFARAFFRNADHRLESGNMNLTMVLEFKSGFVMIGGLVQEHELLDEGYSLSDRAEIPAGTYDTTSLVAMAQFPESRLFQPRMMLVTGQFFDGTFLNGNVGITWRLSRHLELGGEYDLNLVRFPEREQEFNSHVGRLRLRAALNTRLSANTFLQYNSVNEIVSLNGQFRCFISEGRDLWLVINDSRNFHPTRPLIGDLDYRGTRTIILKYTHTFIM